MVKALVFKGERRSKKRKIQTDDTVDGFEGTAENGNGIGSCVAIIDDAGRDHMRKGNDNDIEDGSWVMAEKASDIRGPVLLVLQTPLPSCISCDVYGRVAPSRLENMIDDDRRTAEPHEVRQVWIASQVAGTDKFSFKGHHGRYLSCDEKGLVSAMDEAISPSESFHCTPNTSAPGSFILHTEDGQTLAFEDEVKEARICGIKLNSAEVDIKTDAEEKDLSHMQQTASLYIRMQARFQPRLSSSRQEKTNQKISRSELEKAVGRKLSDEEAKRLKRAKRNGNYHEALLDIKVKSKHDKYS